MVAESSSDALGRRKRTSRVSTGKSITLQDADLLWFQKLHEHGPLPSSFLLQYTACMRRSRKRATERLTDLFNEEETKHGGHYLERPPQQFRTIDSRYNQLVYDLAPAARRALGLQRINRAGRSKSSGPWLHSFMVSCVTASIELATLERSDISFISQSQILERANTELRCIVNFREPGGGRESKKTLIPDAVVGLEYHTPKGSRFRFFAIECDRATEPITTGNFNRKSWLQSLYLYREYVGNSGYKSHLKLSAPLLVLNVTTDEKRLKKMISVTEKEVGHSGNAYLLFQHIQNFGPVFRPPNPMPELLHSPWGRAGKEEFRIDTP